MSESAESTEQKTWVATLIVLLVSGAYFIFLATERLIARDEGFYAIASALVLKGQLPYRDFFYPQMPVLPYVYAGWMKFFGIDWLSIRIFAGCLGAISTAVLFCIARKKMGVVASGITALLFMSSAQAFPWFSVVQTYGLSTLFLLFTTALLLQRGGEQVSPVRLLLAGALFALAVNTRLFFAGLFPILALHTFVKFGFRGVLFFSFGSSVAIVPLLGAYLLGMGEHYWFNNLGYHLMRSDQSFVEGLPKKIKIMKVLTGFAASQKFDGYQFAILAWSSVLLGCTAIARRGYPGLPFLIGIGLMILSLLPTPSYVQYFCACVPFFAISTVQLWSSVYAAAQGRQRAVTISLLIGLLGLYLWTWPGDVHRYTRTGKGVIGIITQKSAQFWNIPNIQEVVPKINSLTDKNDRVFVIWPGLLFGSQALPAEGLENHFGRLAASRLSPEKQKQFRVINKVGINSILREGRVGLAVIHKQALARGLQVSLKKGGYELAEQKNGIYFYRKQDQPPTLEAEAVH